jgi:hypothetical protein
MTSTLNIFTNNLFSKWQTHRVGTLSRHLKIILAWLILFSLPISVDFFLSFYSHRKGYHSLWWGLEE